MKEALCSLKIGLDSIVFGLAQRSKSEYKDFVFKRVPLNTKLSYILSEEVSDRIDEELGRLEDENLCRISRVIFIVPLEFVEKVESTAEKILRPYGLRQTTYRDIEDLLKRAQLLRLNWDAQPIHTFPLEFKLDGKVFRKPPLGIYGNKLFVSLYFAVLKESFSQNSDIFFRKIARDRTFILSSLAEVSSLKDKEFKDKKFLFLKFGATNTEVSLFDNFILRDFGIFPQGGCFIDENISRQFNLPPALSEELKMSYGSLQQEDLEEEKTLTVKSSSYLEIKKSAFTRNLISSYREIIEGLRSYLIEKKFLSQADFLIYSGGVSLIKGFGTFIKNILRLNSFSIFNFLDISDKELETISLKGTFYFFNSKFNPVNHWMRPRLWWHKIWDIWDEYF